VKYEAWLNIDKQYKYHLLSSLTTLQYENFIIQFHNNIKQTEYILFNKLYSLFDINDLKSYNNRELIKLHKISQKIGIYDAIKIFDKVILRNNISYYNVNKLLLYLNDEDNFRNKTIDIKWGPGNHKNINDNVKYHYIKHVLSKDEQWDNISEEEYQQYAIDTFYKITNYLVHTDGKNVYLSGFYNNVFIIGRYHNNIFGISSCYYVKNGQKNGRYNGLCFKI